MNIDPNELREIIIKPTLDKLGKNNKATENLLVAIAQKKAVSMGKGIGIFDIDAAMHRQVWDQYLAFHPELASKIRGLASQREFLNQPDSELATNLCYATAIAWVIYVLHPQMTNPHKVSQEAS